MRVMSLDAEYNQPSRKCIQIGAAIYDAISGQLVDRFQVFVNPGELISEHITDLTGIRDSDVANAPNIKEAFALLKEFKENNGKVFMNPLVWGSGVSNDSQALYKESGSLEENFMGYRVIDVKGIFQSIQIIKKSQFSGSLEKVCNDVLKIGFEGQKHTALADAMNTFRVWHYLIKRFGDLR